MNRFKLAHVIMMVFFIMSSFLVADPVTKTHDFAGGESISAANMNESFDSLYDVLACKIDGANLKSNVGIGTTYPAGLFQVQSNRN